MLTVTFETYAKVIIQSKADAALFVEEFNEPLDPAATDWDSTAWSVAMGECGLTSEQADELWPAYQASLISETKRLTSPVRN